jgi:hypothetical protein
VAPALALAPVAVPADAVKATTANASTASSASFVLPLSRILSPMELIEGGFMPQSPPWVEREYVRLDTAKSM